MTITFTEAQRERLVQLAGAVGIEAPENKNPFVWSTYVAWELVNKIRAVLDEAGFDWKAERRKIKPVTRKRRSTKRSRTHDEDGYPVDVPDDTPCLDDSFHRHEMDV